MKQEDLRERAGRDADASEVALICGGEYWRWKHKSAICTLYRVFNLIFFLHSVGEGQ